MDQKLWLLSLGKASFSHIYDSPDSICLCFAWSAHAVFHLWSALLIAAEDGEDIIALSFTYYDTADKSQWSYSALMHVPVVVQFFQSSPSRKAPTVVGFPFAANTDHF